ncbi:MAG: MobA/MobL family protein, partial [Acidobacteria bacterium]|nr:MobA/MobL family protein [Acidobacteriota bacterium]
AKAIGRSQGRSSTAAAAYRAGVRITDERTGLVFDFRRKRGVDGSEIFTPDGSQPERGALWNAVEKVEKRADAQLAREVEIALPRELNPEQMRAAVRAFVRAEFVARGMVADVAFHHLTGTNPHAHILLTLRAWSAQGFGLKRREWNGRDLCLRWRESWAHHANEALKEAGHEIQIDHRTLVDQAATAAEQERYAEAINLDRVPTIHERGSRAAKSHNERVRQANIAQRLQSEVNEPKTHDDAQPEPEALPSRPLSAMEELAAADRAFEQTMQTQRDSMAALWRRHHDRAQRAAQWL